MRPIIHIQRKTGWGYGLLHIGWAHGTYGYRRLIRVRWLGS